ncbi:MAG: chromosome segregation protein SMC [Candidatus Delongbacteria bacterium]|nr:chromosome segregation protein SMC [Candidatus Delongbacteria bacterium]
MYLSRLELLGFKSFAQKTIVDFNNGVTCVVGPNGCGKTNILDSIRWVLGEQKSSTLRSDKMENVIFNGSRNRKAMGMAEVSLTIENSRNILPMEYNEITLTRRLYRSGESEYLINRVPCRLKDITDLFMDTGMGPNSYSVIELKMVEELLSEKPDERRYLFEEAAGITKYKHRRRAALRKLEETRTDMLRLEDIVSEGERQVSTLKRQVRRTERYREWDTRLTELELRQALAEFNQLMLRRDPLEQAVGELRLELQRIELGLAEAGSRDTELDNQVLGAETERDQAEERLKDTMSRLRTGEREQLVSSERTRALDQACLRLSTESTRLEERLGESSATLESTRARLQETEAAGGDLTGMQREAEDAARASSTRLGEIRRQADTARSSIVQRIERLSRHQSDLARVSANVDSLHQRIADLDEEERLARLDSSLRREKSASLGEELGETQAARIAQEATLEECRVELASAERVLRDKEKEFESRRNELRGATSRRQFLEGILQRFEGVPGGARAVLQQKLEGVLDTLGNLVHSEKDRIRALEAGMGDAASWIVVRDRAALERAAAWLEASGKGDCTFVILEGLPSVTRKAAPAPGLEPLAEGVRCTDAVRPLLELVLANCWLTESLEGLQEINLPAGSFCVTPAGTWFRPPATWHRGLRPEQDQSHLGLRYQLDSLASEITDQEGELQISANAIEQQRTVLEGVRAQVREQEQGLDELRKTLRDLETRNAQLDFAEQNFSKDVESARRNREELVRRCGSEEERERSLKAQIEDLQIEKSSNEDEAAGLFRLLEKLEAENRELVERAGSARLQATEHRMRIENLQREEENLVQFLREGRETLERMAAERSQHQQELARLKAESETRESTLVMLEEARTREQQELDRLRGGLLELKERQKEKHREQDQLHRSKDELTTRLHSAQLELSEIQIRLESLVERAKSDHQTELAVVTDPQELAALLDLDTAAIKREVEELREQIRRLGPVNLLAIEEYDTEKRRLDFLQKQLTDLLEAEAMLKETITRINRVATELFMAAFSKIQTNFDYLFKKLFKTGMATIEMDGSDPLEAKINISATPSGKRIQALTLMSGGEKTLTAIALLFAIYMVKPSPFCILDEVDAPLDDMNIGRFNNIIQEFSEMTQFIIITHNKKTMGYGQSLYGVTMAEPGVSSLVSVQFSEAEKVALA